MINFCPNCGCNLQNLMENSQEEKAAPVTGSDETIMSPNSNEHLQEIISFKDLEYYSEVEEALASIGKSKPRAIKMKNEFTYLVLDSENTPYIIEVGGFQPSIREINYEEYENAKQLPRAGRQGQRAEKNKRMKRANIIANVLFFCAFMMLHAVNLQDAELGMGIPSTFVYFSFVFSLLCFYLKPHISILITLATPTLNYVSAKELYEETVQWVFQNTNPSLVENVVEEMIGDLSTWYNVYLDLSKNVDFHPLDLLYLKQGIVEPPQSLSNKD